MLAIRRLWNQTPPNVAPAPPRIHHGGQDRSDARGAALPMRVTSGMQLVARARTASVPQKSESRASSSLCRIPQDRAQHNRPAVAHTQHALFCAASIAQCLFFVCFLRFLEVTSKPDALGGAKIKSARFYCEPLPVAFADAR